MITLSDRYGDINLEDIEEFEGLEADDEREIDFEKTFQRGEARSFEEDFGYQLDSTLASMEEQEPEWDEFNDAAQEQEDYESWQRQRTEE
jgi:hypothetical protein